MELAGLGAIVAIANASGLADAEPGSSFRAR
jgi:hypothetical protein